VKASRGQPSFSIASVERDTGISKDTLRVWERRYDFPLPLRDQHGERVYTQDQVEKLRTIKRLLDLGYRPGKIVGRSIEELEALTEPDVGGARAQPVSHAHRVVVDLVKQHRVAELRLELGQAVMRQGLAPFLIDTVAPINTAIGEAWMRGQLEIFEEHLYTETLQGVLRSAIAAIPQPGGAPRVLLTTFPNEQHNLGLLMAEAMFAIEGASCISLGTQTPLFDIVLAAASHHADIVALSFSAAHPLNHVLEGLEELRAKLPPAIALWAGGRNAALGKRAIDGVTVLSELTKIPTAIADWRAKRGAT